MIVVQKCLRGESLFFHPSSIDLQCTVAHPFPCGAVLHMKSSWRISRRIKSFGPALRNPKAKRRRHGRRIDCSRLRMTLQGRKAWAHCCKGRLLARHPGSNPPPPLPPPPPPPPPNPKAGGGATPSRRKTCLAHIQGAKGSDLARRALLLLRLRMQKRRRVGRKPMLGTLATVMSMARATLMWMLPLRNKKGAAGPMTWSRIWRERSTLMIMLTQNPFLNERLRPHSGSMIL